MENRDVRLPEHGIRFWTFIFQAAFPPLALILTNLICGKLAYVVSAPPSDPAARVMSLGFRFKPVSFQGVTLIEFLIANFAVLMVFAVTGMAVIEMFTLTFMKQKKWNSFIPRLGERMGFFVVDSEGRPLNGGTKVLLRHLLTYGVYFGGPLLAMVFAAVKITPAAGGVFVLWILYWVLQVVWIEFHPFSRSLHDWILRLWKLETSPLHLKRVTTSEATFDIETLKRNYLADSANLGAR